jgi:teichuronic acid exporter
LPLRKKIFKGIIFLFSQKFLSNIISISSLFLLARILFPEDFGKVALAIAIIRFPQIIGEESIIKLIVPSKEGHFIKEKDDVFSMVALYGLTFGCLFVFFSPFLADFFHVPEISSILPVLVIKFVFDQLRIVPDALLQRQLDFQMLTRRRILFDVAEKVFSVLLAVYGFSFWSLVIPAVVISPLNMFFSFFQAKYSPVLCFNFQRLKQLMSALKFHLGTSLLTLVNREADVLIIGRFLGSELLGVYFLAFKLAAFIQTNFVSVVNSVILPFMGKYDRNIVKLRRIYFFIQRLLVLICFPALLSALVFAEEIVLATYGQKFISAVLPFQILIVFSMRRALTSFSSQVYIVLGKPQIGFFINLTIMPVYLVAVYVGTWWGITGVALAVTITKILAGTIQSSRVAQLLGFSLKDILGNIKDILVNCLVLGIALLVIRYLSLNYLLGVGQWQNVVICGLMLVLFYLILYSRKASEAGKNLRYLLKNIRFG